MKLVEAHHADFVQLGDRDRRMGRAAAPRGQNSVGLQDNADVVGNRIGTDQNQRGFRLLFPEMFDLLFGIDRPAGQGAAAHPDADAEERPFKVPIGDKGPDLDMGSTSVAIAHSTYLSYSCLREHICL